MVIAGWYGSDNTGDEAVLEAIVAALRKRGISDLHALSISPAKTSTRLGIASSPRAIAHPRTLRALVGARALVLGGGGLIQDRTSVYNLPVYALLVLLARLFGAEIIGWGLGVEPLDTLLGKLLARFICDSSAFFSVRDEGSKRLLARAGVASDGIRVSADPAFLLCRGQGSGVRDQGLAEGTGPWPLTPDPYRRPNVIFCLRDLPDNRPGLNPHYLLPIGVRRVLGVGTGGRSERSQAFVRVMAHAVRVCAVELGARVTFVPLWRGRDDEIMRAVSEAAVGLGTPPALLGWAGTEAGEPAGIAGAIGAADLLVSMRLHALIFAARGGVPFLALAYARKVRGLSRMLGAERWVVEVENRVPGEREVEGLLRRLWETREQQSAALALAAEQARGRAEQDADSIFGVLKEVR